MSSPLAEPLLGGRVGSKCTLGLTLIVVAGVVVVLALAIGLGVGLSAARSTGGGGGGGGGPPVGTVAATASELAYSIPGTAAGGTLYTVPATHRVGATEPPPSATGAAEVFLSAAKGEFEPAVVVVRGATGSSVVSWTSFASLGGTGARIDGFFVSAFPSGLADDLSQLTSGATVPHTSGRNTVIWLDVFVPRDANSGNHTAALTIDGVTVTLRLRVFNFAIPRAATFATQMNMGIPTAAQGGLTNDQAKLKLFEHRWTTDGGAVWPSGFGPSITWESTANPNRCAAFFDEPAENECCSVKKLSDKFLKGIGWNGGQGFPLLKLFQFVSNSQTRPSTFCGVSLGPTQEGTPAYNAAWQSFLTQLQSYLTANGLLSQTYIYTQNEPQTAADDALAYSLCRTYKAGAPNIRLAISEEPKSSIVNGGTPACGYDIWIAHLATITPATVYINSRIALGEALWMYSLPQDTAPLPTPVLAQAQGVHIRSLTWIAWSIRATGFAYYDSVIWWGPGPKGEPRIRAKLFREAMEDYEIMVLANGNLKPRANTEEALDPTVRSISTSLNSWSKDPSAYHILKRDLGLFVGGERATLPVLVVQSSRPRGAYNINFQGAQPAADPLVVDGLTWIKAGTSSIYATSTNGLGFTGENVGTAIFKSDYGASAPFNEVTKSFVFDDNGRVLVFEFDIAPGRYRVTTSVGNPSRGYPGDPHNVKIEGQHVLVDYITTNAAPIKEVSADVNITDGAITLEYGGKAASTGQFAYTFAQWVKVLPI